MATSDHIAPFVPLGTATVHSMAVQDKTLLRSEALHEWRRVFEGDNDETEDHGDYWNDWSLDYNVNEKCILFRQSRDTN
jgi:hypothetical protein